MKSVETRKEQRLFLRYKEDISELQSSGVIDDVIDGMKTNGRQFIIESLEDREPLHFCKQKEGKDLPACTSEELGHTVHCCDQFFFSFTTNVSVFFFKLMHR